MVASTPIDCAEFVAVDLASSRGRERLARLRLQPHLELPTAAEEAGRRIAALALGGPSIAICMATCEPDETLLRRQLQSIRQQSWRRWVCIISDDRSSPQALSMIDRLIGGDERFILVPSDRRRGVYGNFERALSTVPTGVDYVALADQDDLWTDDKLEVLVAALGTDACLAYSDMRIVDSAGVEISPTYWSHRSNNFDDFGGLMIANTVTGAATLIRRRLLDRVLPFPPADGVAMHDHWIAQVAIASGPIAYVDRPLMDYVQHSQAALGHRRANADGRYGGSLVARARAWGGLLSSPRQSLDWRRAYFDLYCRVVQSAATVGIRCEDTLEPEQREVLERLVDPNRASAWLACRVAGARGRGGATLGREQVLLAALAWSKLARVRQLGPVDWRAGMGHR